MAMKKRRRSQGIVAVDRLSDLPDEVLGNILSFLPTKKAVQTSVLSRRWKGVFSLATSLDFDDSFSYEAKGFINFVERVLLLHKVSIKRFKLIVSSSDMKDASCVNAWIASALSLGAQELDLDLGCRMDDITQHKLLSSCMMTVLILKYGFYVDSILKVPTCVCLCSLRVLNLDRIIFPDVDSTSRFFIGCSSLTDLTLSGCEWMEGGVYKLSFPKLTNLTIDDLNPLRCSTKPIIELDLPHVVYFKCCSCPWNLWRIKNPVVICTAEFDFSCLSGAEGAQLLSLTRLMKQLSDVKVLRLLGESLTVINRIKLSKLPTCFVNLSRLEVETRYGERRKGWKRLPKLIARAPMLETLVFKRGLETCYNDLVAFLEVQRKPISKNHLAIVVERYRGEKREYRMLKLFLKSVAFNVKQLIVKRAEY